MRILGWFSKLLVTALLVSFLSVFTTMYMVDLYINRFLEQFNMSDIGAPSMDSEDFVSKLTNPFRLWNDDETMSNPNNGDDIPVFSYEFEQPSPVQQDSASQNSASQDSASQNSASQDAKSQDSTSQDSVALKDTLVMSAEEFNEKRKKLTNQDKTAIFSIVMTKLPQKKLQEMSTLIEDGITEEELTDLNDVINAYLQQDEVAQLLAILNKY